MSRDSHGGNLESMAEIAACSPEEILDFSANLNPLGFPNWVRPLILSKISGLNSYPDSQYRSLRISMMENWGISPDRIAFGNGASEFIYSIPKIRNFETAILPVPSYREYEKALNLENIPFAELKLLPENDFALDLEELENLLKNEKEKDNLVFLAHPNNPTGKLLDREKITNLAVRYPNSFFVIDESFLDFQCSEISFRNTSIKNIAVLWSFTKILALPGLRIGAFIAAPSIIEQISKFIPPWALNSLGASVLEKAGYEKEFFRETKHQVKAWRSSFIRDLESMGLFRIYESQTNFILLEILDSKYDAAELRNLLLREYKIGIRDCADFSGLGSNFFRIAVRNPEENSRLLQALSSLYKTKRIFSPPAKPTPALMLQGTASNVGKSILTTALCRIFTQDGFKVAPFKSQNMALNSFVTYDGAEIGRAQALQAQACKILPDYRMNPILLKPSNDKDSQVILNGKPLEAMDFRDYTKFKTIAFEEVRKSYDSLSREFDMVLLEGAGGASEVNLKANDIVNMRMARHANAKVLLVGNIDHGGVFGAFVGTLETMAEWERNLIAGFVINRFRGIKELLDSGIKYLENTTNKKVFGIVPFLKHLQLPEEDSLEFKSGTLSDTSSLGDRIDIAVIDTPRISNHTDLDSLRIEPDVRVRIVTKKEEIGEPDVLILPGSKNVITDLDFLRESGIADSILHFSKDSKTEIVGICGGYQILGESIHDPHKIETDRGSADGLNLLSVRTVLEKDKYLKQTDGVHLPSGKNVKGYEIHHGVTKTSAYLLPVFRNSKGEDLGHQGASDTIWGTYLHGVFDEDGFRRWFIDRIRVRKGMLPLVKIQAKFELETSIDRLANEVRSSLDMKQIYKTLGI